jgi:hypothetical protein
MADKGWTGQMAAAAGLAAGTGAAQLGLGYGLGVVVWPTTMTADDSVWLGSLGWATWIAASSTVFGAVLAARLRPIASEPPVTPGRRPSIAGSEDGDPIGDFGHGDSTAGSRYGDSTGDRTSSGDEPVPAGATRYQSPRPEAARPPGPWRLALATVAALGALVTVALIALPARAAIRTDAYSPETIAAGYALVGVLLGLAVAYWAVVSRPVAANLIATAVWLWALAIAAIIVELTTHRASATYLTSWQFAALDETARYGTIYWPSALLTLLAALLIGMIAAWPAVFRGDFGLGTASSGAVGPLLVAAAFLALAPRLTGALGPLQSAYLVAPYAVLAGLAGSALTVALGRQAAERRARQVRHKAPPQPSHRNLRPTAARDSEAARRRTAEVAAAQRAAEVAPGQRAAEPEPSHDSPRSGRRGRDRESTALPPDPGGEPAAPADRLGSRRVTPARTPAEPTQRLPTAGSAVATESRAAGAHPGLAEPSRRRGLFGWRKSSEPVPESTAGTSPATPAAESTSAAPIVSAPDSAVADKRHGTLFGSSRRPERPEPVPRQAPSGPPPVQPAPTPSPAAPATGGPRAAGSSGMGSGVAATSAAPGPRTVRSTVAAPPADPPVAKINPPRPGDTRAGARPEPAASKPAAKASERDVSPSASSTSTAAGTPAEPASNTPAESTSDTPAESTSDTPAEPASDTPADARSTKARRAPAKTTPAAETSGDDTTAAAPPRRAPTKKAAAKNAPAKVETPTPPDPDPLWVDDAGETPAPSKRRFGRRSGDTD